MIEGYTIGRQGLHSGAEVQLDTGGSQCRLDLCPRPRSELTSDGLGPVDQYNAQPLGRALGAVIASRSRNSSANSIPVNPALTTAMVGVATWRAISLRASLTGGFLFRLGIGALLFLLPL